MPPITEIEQKITFSRQMQAAALGHMMADAAFAARCKNHFKDSYFIDEILGNIFNGICAFISEYRCIQSPQALAEYMNRKGFNKGHDNNTWVNDCASWSTKYPLLFITNTLTDWARAGLFASHVERAEKCYRNHDTTEMTSIMRSFLEKATEVNFTAEIGYETGNFFADISNAFNESNTDLTTGVKEFDEALGGGLMRGEHTVLLAPLGIGKCHGKNTPIMMSDGRTKLVQDIVPGELLMGPDGSCRNVLSTTKGFGQLYEVIPDTGGDSFVCNDAHVLSLKVRHFCQWDNVQYKGTKHSPGSIINMPIREYLQTSKSFKYKVRLWKVSLDFEEKTLPINPYVLGIWLGDGHSNRAALTTMDDEIKDSWCNWVKENGDEISTYEQVGNKANSYSSTNKGIWFGNKSNQKLRDLKLLNNKHIPHEYLTSSKEQRLNLLAGIIDTDGYLGTAEYELSTKLESLSKEYAFLARSLGFRVKISKTFKKAQTGVGDFYYRITLNGKLSQIPCKLARKISLKDNERDVLISGFTIKDIGYGDFYGFTLDKDHLYLLGDFTVTHNTTTCLNFIAANIMRSKHCLLITHEGRPQDTINKLRQRMARATRQDFYDAVQGNRPTLLKILEEVEKKLNNYLCFIPHSKAGSLFIEDVVDIVRMKNDQLHAKTGKSFDFLCDDYPGKLLSREMKGFKEFRHSAKHIYDTFQHLALELNCHAMSPVQTNREGLKQNRDRDGSNFVGTGQIGESLGIGQDASNIISINRSLDDIRKNIMYFHIAKTRQGPSEISVCVNTCFEKGITHDQELGASVINNNIVEPRKQVLSEIVGGGISIGDFHGEPKIPREWTKQ